MKYPIKIEILPTKDESRLCITDTGVIGMFKSPQVAKFGVNQYLYITVSQEVEPIKEGDWVYFYSEDVIIKFNSKIYGSSDCRKIIATTDPGLYITVGEHYNAYNKELPKIPLSFLKEFVANSDGEWEVEYEVNHKCTIEGVTPCLTDMKLCDVNGCETWHTIKLNQNNTVNISPVGEKMYSRGEVDKCVAEIYREHYDMHRRGLFDFPEKEDWVKEKVKMFYLNNHELLD